MSSQADPSHFIGQRELSRRWGLSIGTLTRWRSQGRGPSWVRIGKQIRYRMQDVQDYELAQRKDQKDPK